MALRTTLKAVNAELARRGYQALLERGPGYFYFHTGEAAEWLDRTVNVPTLNALTPDEWAAEFERLRKLNRQIMGKPAPRPAAKKRRTAK